MKILMIKSFLIFPYSDKNTLISEKLPRNILQFF